MRLWNATGRGYLHQSPSSGIFSAVIGSKTDVLSVSWGVLWLDLLCSLKLWSCFFGRLRGGMSVKSIREHEGKAPGERLWSRKVLSLLHRNPWGATETVASRDCLACCGKDTYVNNVTLSHAVLVTWQPWQVFQQDLWFGQCWLYGHTWSRLLRALLSLFHTSRFWSVHGFRHVKHIGKLRLVLFELLPQGCSTWGPWPFERRRLECDPWKDPWLGLCLHSPDILIDLLATVN